MKRITEPSSASVDLPNIGEDLPIPAERWDAKTERKMKQLCRQVEIRLSLVFAGIIEDPLLQGLLVESVDPEPDGRSLMVTVIMPDDQEVRDPVLIHQRLIGATGMLRSEVATAIHRKRTPLLLFDVRDPTIKDEPP